MDGKRSAGTQDLAPGAGAGARAAPIDIQARRQAIERYAVLDTPPEPAFDELVEIAAAACETPIALVTLLDRERQWHKAERGLGLREIPIEESICEFAVRRPGAFVVEDLRSDPRFRDNPLVLAGPRMCFYAGAPIVTPEGTAIGAVCVIDRAPRRLQEEKLELLKALARQAAVLLELRRALAELDRARVSAHRSEVFLRETVDALTEHIAIVDLGGSIAYVNRAWDDFARRNAEPVLLAGLGAGTNYLEVCERAARRGAKEAAAVAQAIAAALAGPSEAFSIEYACHSPGERRWFVVRVTAFAAGAARYALVSHQNITARKRAELGVHELNEQLEERVRARTEALAGAERELRRLARRLLETEERERRGIGRELHDRVGQNLSALNLNLQLIRQQLSASSSERIADRLAEVQRLLQDTTREVRGVMVELRPPGLDEEGLASALSSYAEHLAGHFPARITVLGGADAPRLPPETEFALFRIAQEALNNVAKHARARGVEVRVEAHAAGQRMVISDDGIGFEPGAASAASWGLATMRERAEAVHARLSVDSAPGRGTRVTVEVAG